MDATFAQLLLRGSAVGLMGVGAYLDLRTRRIPNALTLGGALAGLVVNIGVHQLQGALSSLEGWAVGVALLAIPFILGGMGAGDVKLLALAGAWGGPSFVLFTLIFGALVGGVVAVGVLIAHGRLGAIVRPMMVAMRIQVGLMLGALWPRALALAAIPGPGVFDELAVAPRKLRFPYGPALAIGGLVALLLR